MARTLEYELFRMKSNSSGVQVYPEVQQAFRARCAQVRRCSSSPRMRFKRVLEMWSKMSQEAILYQ